MEDLQTADISLSPEWVTAHLRKLKKDFADFKSQIEKEYKELEKDNQYLFDAYHFDLTGESYVSLSKLSAVELKLLAEIKKRFSYSNFFKEKNDRLYNRQQVYYSVLKDELRLYQAVKTFIYLDSLLFLIQEIDINDLVAGSFVIASMLDDIRYKLILLYEDVLLHNIPLNVKNLEDLVEKSIVTYYSYLLGRPQTTISYIQLNRFAEEVREFITDYLNKFDPNLGPIRPYKEGDVPSDNLLFIQKLKKNLPPENIDVIIGVRFGGIELPYLIRHFIFPEARIKLEKISNYSDANSDLSLKLNVNDLKHKNILIVDDGITTGRTVKKLIDTIKDNCDNVYFACIYYSGFKRIKHMQRDNHGGVSLEQLKKCCVLRETNYTAAVNKKSYTNHKGKFDKTKAKVEAKARLGELLFDIEIPVAEPMFKDTNSKKVFIACSLSYISEGYDYLIYIRNIFQRHQDYEIIDDWLVNRIEKVEGVHKYKEISGRNFLFEAIRDIEMTNIVVLFCPGPSAYISSLFLFAAMREKEILVFFRKGDDIKEFKNYKKGRFIPIKQINTVFKKWIQTVKSR
jgi:hypoxanthine phosphoribosyltransferase